MLAISAGGRAQARGWAWGSKCNPSLFERLDSGSPSGREDAAARGQSLEGEWLSPCHVAAADPVLSCMSVLSLTLAKAQLPLGEMERGICFEDACEG